MKKIFMLICMCLLLITVTACGSRGSDYGGKKGPGDSPSTSSSVEMAMDVGENGTPNLNTNGNGGNPPKSLSANRKIIKHNQLELQTKEFETSYSKIFEIIESMGGYVEFQESYGRSLYGDRNSERHAIINARIPSEKLEETSSQIGDFCNILSQNSNIEDITDSYFDTDARLKALQIQESRLLELLTKAESMEDIITIEQKLSEIRYEIERLTASLNKMDNQVAYSYLNISLQEVIEYDVVNETFGNRIIASLNRSGSNIVNWLQNAIFFIIESLPIILLNLAILGIVVFIIIKISRKFSVPKKLKKSKAMNEHENNNLYGKLDIDVEKPEDENKKE